VPSIYKIVPAALWREAERAGVFRGAPVDIADGFIHFSTTGQIEETAAKHFAGQNDLLLVGCGSARHCAEVGAFASRSAFPSSLWRFVGFRRDDR
jgi:uncharacterized protein (DUF952 family)